MSWIGDPSRTSSVLWFNGPAGTGKTAIAQSLCKLCVAAKWLAGSFFFSRHAPGRNNADFLFPTISFGLSYAIPSVGKIIDAVVAHDPSIPTKALEIQLQKLILDPLHWQQFFLKNSKEQVSEESKQPIVIIIDGLDECEGEDMQSNILRLLGSVFQRPSVRGLGHDRICFIVASRPEPWIHDEFSIEPLSSITRQIFLDQTSEANDDIRTFLRLGFTAPSHYDERCKALAIVSHP
jgi:NACHT domain